MFRMWGLGFRGGGSSFSKLGSLLGSCFKKGAALFLGHKEGGTLIWIATFMFRTFGVQGVRFLEFRV